MNKLYPNSMQLTRYNLDLFQPIKADNPALIGSNRKTPQKNFFFKSLPPSIPDGLNYLESSPLIYQEPKQTHRRPFRAKFWCF